MFFCFFFLSALFALITPRQDEQSGLFCRGCERNSQSSPHLWPSHTAAACCCLSFRLFMFPQNTKTLQRVVPCVAESAAAAHSFSNCKNLFQKINISLFPVEASSASWAQDSQRGALPPPSLFPSSAFPPTPQIPGPLQTHNQPECDFSVSSRLFEFPGGQQGLGSASPAPPDLQPNTRAAQLPASLHSAPPNP